MPRAFFSMARHRSDQAIETSTSLVARGVAPFALALTLGWWSTANAELTATPAQPLFSETDLRTIARNESLRDAVGTSPWLVHRILRLLDDVPSAGRELAPSKDRPGTRDLDPGADPDLQPLQRTSPEAAHELFLLIKQVRKDGAK